jgi:hypothetical protein
MGSRLELRNEAYESPIKGVGTFFPAGIVSFGVARIVGS